MKMKNLLLVIIATLGLSTSTMAQNLPNYIPANGLVGWWPFNGNANDESGNNHNLIPNGDASLSADRNGLSVSAYSLTDVINNSRLKFSLADYSLIDNFTQGSLTMWVKINSHDITNHYFGFDNMFIVRHKTGVNAQLYLGLLGGTMKLRMHLNGALPNTGDLTSNSSLTINTWYNIVYTWDGSTEKIYINGVLDNEMNSTKYIPALSNPDMFCLGSYNGVGSNSTNSNLDDIGIWNRALSGQEIQALYNGCNIAPNSIVGNITPEIFLTETYTCNNTPGSTYEWSVTNGVITAGQGTNSISVIWGGTGLGTISVQENTSATCQGDLILINVVVIPTGLEKVNERLIHLYPNPTNSHITIDYGNFAVMNGYTLKITNSIGQIVFTTPINQQSSYVDLSTWSGNGIYFVHIIDAQGNTIDIRKIVLQ